MSLAAAATPPHKRRAGPLWGEGPTWRKLVKTRMVNARPMLRGFLSVGALTGLSRVSGFLRDLVIGAVIGAGPVADAFFVALRLPNQFRAIFGEGAFTSAYLPTYARVLSQQGAGEAKVFSGRVLSLLLMSQIALLALALLFTPTLVEYLAPGFKKAGGNFDLAVTLTRITFPYLLCVTLGTLQSATQNAHGHFAMAAFAPVLLNLFIIAFLFAAHWFPGAAIAASWGVTASGVAQLAMLAGYSWRHGLMETPAWPKFTPEVKTFFVALGPAVIGSAGQQIAILADTILASLLPPGSVSSIYYADRLNQLPLGVIGVAAGTVLLPEMSRRLAQGDADGASAAQNRSIGLTFLLTAPFLALFLAMPLETISGAFLRGAFDLEAAQRAGAVLGAYALGLAPMVLIRSNAAGFQARGDTFTPAACFFGGLAINIVLKITLSKVYGSAGLALATSAGAWVNFLALVFVGLRRGVLRPDAGLLRSLALGVFGSGLAVALAPAMLGAVTPFLSGWPLHNELVALAAVTLVFAVYVLAAACGWLIYRL